LLAGELSGLIAAQRPNMSGAQETLSPPAAAMLRGHGRRSFK
jgi:hypothetical protein